MDTVDPLRFILAFCFVLGLIGLLALGLKRFGGGIRMKTDGGRLAVVEMKHIDPRRKLVLVRRDNREHLLLLAGERELVIESNIVPVMMAADLKHEPGHDA